MKKATQSTFILRGINHQRLVREYLEGAYKDISLPTDKPSFPKGKGVVKTHLQETGVGKDSNDAIYERKSGESRYRVYTTNSDTFKTYLSEMSSEPSGKKKQSKSETVKSSEESCDHCRQKITGDILVVPIYMQRKVLAGDDTPQITVISGEYIAGHYCCALAIIREELRKNPLSSQYKNSEQILKQICISLKGQYPKNPAPHWKLLTHNKGSMEPDVFYAGEAEFRKNPSLVFVPVKSQWETKLRD